MKHKPSLASGYDPGDRDRVHATCLYVATKLGDLVDDTVIVGGLVPSLLVDQRRIQTASERHVGTMDLDIGLALAIFDERRYEALTERLRQAGFEPDENEKGQRTRQRWRIDREARVTVDFLIAPSLPDDKPGRIRNIESDFAAIIAPGLHLAFSDRVKMRLNGRTIAGESASREIWVAGPGAYVVLKALAFKSRGENKDAYDLFYVLRYLEAGLADVASRLRLLANDRSTQDALAVLREDFSDVDGLGSTRVAEFLTGGPDDDVQADARGVVLDLLERFEGEN